MTVIVGVKDKDRVLIGGDSAGVDDWYGLVIRSDPKVVQVRNMLIGFTSSFRMGQLLAHSLPGLVQPEKDEDVFGWMVGTFIDAVRNTLKSGGFAHRENEVERGGSFLVAFRGRLFEIGPDYQVGENADGVAAVGCGYMIALGALHASRAVEDPEQRVRMALEAAEHFSAVVRGPFRVMSIDAAGTVSEEVAP